MDYAKYMYMFMIFIGAVSASIEFINRKLFGYTDIWLLLDITVTITGILGVWNIERLKQSKAVKNNQD